MSFKLIKMTAYYLQFCWPQNSGSYVTNYFEWISTVIYREAVGDSCRFSRKTMMLTVNAMVQPKIQVMHGYYFRRFSIFHKKLRENIPGKVL